MLNKKVLTLFGPLVLFIFMYAGYLLFGDDIKKEFSNNSTEQSLPDTSEEQYDEIKSAFDGRYPETYKEFSYIYNLETKIVYEKNTDELLEFDFYKKSRQDYFERINSPNWNGILPNKVEIHIKERWNNTPAQIKQLFELSKKMEKNEVLFSTIVYNPTTNLEDTPSVWFTISDTSNDLSGLAQFEKIKSIEDIKNTDTLYKGLFRQLIPREEPEDDFSNEYQDYDTVKFDSSKI